MQLVHFACFIVALSQSHPTGDCLNGTNLQCATQTNESASVEESTTRADSTSLLLTNLHASHRAAQAASNQRQHTKTLEQHEKENGAWGEARKAFKTNNVTTDNVSVLPSQHPLALTAMVDRASSSFGFLHIVAIIAALVILMALSITLCFGLSIVDPGKKRADEADVLRSQLDVVYEAARSQASTAASTPDVGSVHAQVAEDANLNSLWQTALNLSNTILGSGVLVLPYAIEQGGAVIGLLVIPVAALMGTTMYIIGKVLELNDSCAESQGILPINRDMGFLGMQAFGAAGQSVIYILLFADLYGVLLSYMIVAATNIHEVVSQLTVSINIFLLGPIIFGMLFVPPHRLDVFSILGVGGMVLVFAGLVVTWIELEVEGKAANEFVPIKVSGALNATGILLFLNNAHSCCPFLYQTMQQKDQWHYAVALAVSGSALLYLLVGGIAQMAFGGSTQPVLISNLGNDLNLQTLESPLAAVINTALPDLCAILIAVKLVASIPIYAMPILIAGDRLLHIQETHALQVVWRVLFMACTTSVAWAFHSRVPLLVELVGTTVNTWMALILPFAMLLRFSWGSLHLCTKLLLIIALLGCGGYWIVGTEEHIKSVLHGEASSMRRLVEGWSRGN